MVVQRNQRADRKRNRGRYNPVVHVSLNVIALQRPDALLRKPHSSRLSIADDHVNLRLKTSQFLQHLKLKIAVSLQDTR